jgi:8-oxo-dGTP pyrophosphatase MutT (NUDIX family)
VSSQVVYAREPWLVVSEDHVQLGNGVEIPNFIRLQEPDVAMVLAVTSDGQVPLVTQYRHGIGQMLLDLPAGYVDGDEDTLLAAQRELVEETGYVGGTWAHVGSLWRNSSRGRHRLHIYVAQGVQPHGQRHLDATEELDVQLVPLADLTQLVLSGQIAGMSSAAAVLLGLSYLAQEVNQC